MKGRPRTKKYLKIIVSSSIMDAEFELPEDKVPAKVKRLKRTYDFHLSKINRDPGREDFVYKQIYEHASIRVPNPDKHFFRVKFQKV